MTGEERTDLKLALDFLREWRDDDRAWKARADGKFDDLNHRVGALETQDAIEFGIEARAEARRQKGALAATVRSAHDQARAAWINVGLTVGGMVAGLVAYQFLFR